MNPIKMFFDRFAAFGDQPALQWRNETFSYNDFLLQIKTVEKVLERVPAHSVLSVEATDSPLAYAALFAAFNQRQVVVPMLSTLPESIRTQQRKISQAEYVLTIQEHELSLRSTNVSSDHPLYKNLKQGLVLFSSGSTASPKGIVHDFQKLAKRFEPLKPPRRFLQFLLFDHIGGLNTAFSALSRGGCLNLIEQKDPPSVVEALKQHNIEILPTSPSFLNWLLLSQELESSKLPHLQLITYGTEPMSALSLRALKEKLPAVSFKQTYGLSEIGILATRSKSDDSTWLQIREDLRVRDGLLEIKAPTSMIGYLNAENPFTVDGWFQTRDAVEVDGDWLRILGRQSEMINVGGVKVSPIEVEGVLLAMPEVANVAVLGEPNPLLGAVIKAQVHLKSAMSPSDFRTRMRLFCRDKIEPCKIPQVVEIVSGLPPKGSRKKASFPTV